MSNFVKFSDYAYGDVLIGGWLSLGSIQLAEICVDFFDFIVVDLEHTTVDLSFCEDVIRISSNKNKPCLVRVSGPDKNEIKTVLDCGASGIIGPMTNNKVVASDYLKHMFYPPMGERGVGLYRAHNYGLSFDSYLEESSDVIFLAQIEHFEGISNLGEILRMPKCAGSFLGPYDLSASLGVSGKFDSPEFLSSIAEFDDKHACGWKGFHLVHYTPEKYADLVSSGYNLIVISSDMLLIQRSLNSLKEELSCMR